MLIQSENGTLILKEPSAAYLFRREETGKVHVACPDCHAEPEWNGEAKQECACGRSLVIEQPETFSLSQGETPMQQQLELSKVKPSKDNPRTTTDEKELAQLKASIKKHGVLEPILVRPKDGHFEIVFGERRFRACRELQMESIPAMVRELSDKQAEEMRLVENLQRQDLNPMDEALAMKRLQELHGLSLRQLSEHLAKSHDYVKKRLAITELDEEYREQVRKGELALGHALLLLRLPNAEDRKEFFSSLVEYKPSVQEALTHLEREYAMRLDRAPFPAEECRDCPCRSDNQKLLFAEKLSKEDMGVCTDKARFQEKVRAWREKQEAAIQGKGCALFASEHDLRGVHGRTAIQLTAGSHGYAEFDQEIVKSTCAATCPKALYAWGQYSEENSLDLYCVDKKCRTETFLLRQEEEGNTSRKVNLRPEKSELREMKRRTAAQHFRQQFIVEEAVKRLPGNLEAFKKLLLYHFVYDVVKEPRAFVNFGFVKQESLGYIRVSIEELLKHEATQEELDGMILSTLRVVLQNYRNYDAEEVGKVLNIKPEEEFLITREYLNTFSKEELASLAQEIGLVEHLSEMKKLPKGNLASQRKGELITLFLETGFELQGRVPQEIKDIYRSIKDEADEMKALEQEMQEGAASSEETSDDEDFYDEENPSEEKSSADDAEEEEFYDDQDLDDVA